MSEPPAHDAPGRDAATIPAGTYQVDPARSRLKFRAKAFGLMWVRGRIPVTSGTIRITEGQLEGSGEIGAAEINTGLAARDWHLRTSHYLHTRAHPRIRVSFAGADLGATRADCTVTVRGTPSTVPMRVRRVAFDDGTLRIEADVALDRTPYRMLPPLAGVSRVVHVDVEIAAIQASVAPS
jgi:polyisoprenoid-binding protein YceI